MSSSLKRNDNQRCSFDSLALLLAKATGIPAGEMALEVGAGIVALQFGPRSVNTNTSGGTGGTVGPGYAQLGSLRGTFVTAAGAVVTSTDFALPANGVFQFRVSISGTQVAVGGSNNAAGFWGQVRGGVRVQAGAATLVGSNIAAETGADGALTGALTVTAVGSKLRAVMTQAGGSPIALYNVSVWIDSATPNS